MKIESKRVFKLDGKLIEDPNPELIPDQVLSQLAKKDASLLNAILEQPEVGDEGEIVYPITKRVGDKG